MKKIRSNLVKYMLGLLLCLIAGHASAVPVISSITRNNQCDGLIIVNATGTGTLFYAIKKTTDANYSSKQTSNEFAGLTTGTYTVMVYDNTGQTQSSNIVVDNKNILSVTSPPDVTTSVVSCTETGKITVKVQKGSSPYTYQLVSGPVTRPPQTFPSSNNQFFSELPTGIYSVSISDACGTVIYLNDIHVISNGLNNKTLDVFEYGGPVTYTSNGCDISLTRNINYINLKDITGDTLYGFGSGRTIPAGSGIEARLEYPAGSGIYTAWGSLSNFTIPSASYKPAQTSYRIQLRNPCNTSNIVTSPVYQLPYPYNWERTVCGYELFRQVTGYVCSGATFKLVNSVNSAQTYSFTWNGSGSTYALDLSAVPEGTYHTYFTVNNSTYQTADLVKDQSALMDVGLTADVYNYLTDMGCDFTTVGVRVTNIPAGNTTPITYTINSGPVSRPPVTSTQNITLWSDLPQGTYRIGINRGTCGVDEQTITVQPPFSRFDATVSFQAGFTCGWYKITGKGWYLDPSGQVSGSDVVYGVAVFNASTNILVGTASDVTNNTSFVTDINLQPGTYRVRFSGRAPTNTCYYIERTVIIPVSDPLVIDVATTGGLVCPGGLGTLHIGIAGGNGQPINYRIRPASSQNESAYTAYQLSPNFSNLQAGTYTVQINNGCDIDTRNVTLEESSTTSTIETIGSLCARTDAVLRLQAIGAISNVQWTLPNGTTRTGQSITVPNLSADNDGGIYTVTFNSSGCSWTNSTILTVKPKPEFSFATSITACQPVNLQTLTLESGNIAGLTLAYFDASYQQVVNPAQAGSGIYHLVGTSSVGCSDTSTVAVTVNPVATEALITTYTTNVCSGIVATIMATALETAGIINPVIRWYTDQTSTTPISSGSAYTVGAYNVNTTTTYTWYASVSGDNYCENLPGTRKAVILNVHPKPTVQIQTSQDINNICHDGTIALNAVTTGTITWIGWYDTKGSVSNYDQFAPDPHAASVVYNPDILESGKTSKLYVRVYDQYCGYIADTIRLQILPLPTVEKFELVTQPLAFQEMCTDTVYEVKIKADKKSDLRNLKVMFHDYNATGISIKQAVVKHPYVGGTWKHMTDSVSDITGVTWALPDPLLRGDSLLMQIKVAAECGFYSGANMALRLNAQSVCGDKLDEQTILTKTFNTKQDTAQLNTYLITSTFSINKVTNNSSDTVTWRLQAVVKGDQATDSENEGMYILVPAGFNLVPDSYKPIRNAPTDLNSMEIDPTEFGAEIMLPIVGGLRNDSVIIAEFKFTTTDAPCKDYHFYAEVVFSDSVYCGNTLCVFHSTRGGSYPTLTVERYQLILDGDAFGQTVFNNTGDTLFWSGGFTVKPETQFYAGDSIFVDFYIDRNGDRQPDPSEWVKSFTHITADRSPGNSFTANFNDVPVEAQKQLLARVHGDVLCSDVVISIAILSGIDTVCEQDTTLYHTVPGMENYKFLVDGVSGATPVRIPLEGSNTDNYIKENVARVVWKKKGNYKVWAQYSLPTNPPKEIGKTYFPVTVNERPVIKLARNADTTICIGAEVDLRKVFLETTGIGTISYYRKENNGAYTLLSGQSPFIVSPADTITYGADAVSLSTGCASLEKVDFKINVARMPQIGTISVDSQPDCFTNTGSIKVVVTEGSGSYIYSLNGGTEAVFPTDGIIGNLPVGDYRVYVKNSSFGGCSPSISEMVSLSPSSNGLHANALTTNASACNSNDGSIQLTVNGGTPPYRYRIEGGSLSPLPANGIIGNNFAPGNYNITILDVTNCATTASVVQVKPTTGLSISPVQIAPADCNTSGTLHFTISGGVEPYSYRLSGKGWVEIVGNSVDISIGASEYEIFAKDVNGCETSVTARMKNTKGLSISLAGVVNAACNGVGEGSVQLTIVGKAPLSVSYDGGKTKMPVTAGTITLDNLKSGVYHFLLTDGDGCMATLEGIRVDEEVNFLQAVDNRAYTYVNHSVSGYITYNDYEHDQQKLTVIGYSQARNGFINVSSNGAFDYEPDLDFVGNDSVQYSIKNPCGFISTAWLHIFVLDTLITGNRPPIAMDDEYIVREGESLSNFDVTKNDIDPDGDPLTMPVAITQVLRGTLTQNGDGTFNYTPNPNFVGVDVFTYRICDDKGACSTAQVHITVLPATIYDGKIIALPDAYTVNQYDTLRVTSVAEGILGNDIYPAGAITEIVITDEVLYGTLDMHADGTFIYTPNIGYSGFDGFTYALCSTNLPVQCDTAWVSIFVAQRPCTALNGTYIVGNVPGAHFATLKEAADNYNDCGILSNSRLVIAGDLTETGTVEFKGSAPGSTQYTLTIVSDGTRHTISGNIDGPLIKLTGANNIIIDGLQAATAANPSAPLLSFVNTYATSSANVRAISMVKEDASNGKHVRIRNSEWSVSQKLAGMVISSHIDSLFIENSYIHDGHTGINASGTTLHYVSMRNNIVSGLNLHGIYLLPNATANLTVTGNTVKDIVPATAGSKATGITIQHSATSSGAWNISDNRVLNISNMTSYSCTTEGIHIQSNNANIQCSNNMVDGLVNNYASATAGYGLVGISILQTGTGTLLMTGDTARNLTSESYTMAFAISRDGATGNATLRKLVASNISGKSERPQYYDVAGIFFFGKGNIEASTITGLRNPNGSATGILVPNTSSGYPVVVSNNMISDIVAAKAMGISGSGVFSLYHNTVRLTSKTNDTDEATAVNIGNRQQNVSTSVTLQNNLLSNEVPNGATQNFVIKRQPSVTIISAASANNRYNIANGNVAMLVTDRTTQAGTVYVKLSAWTAVSNDNSMMAVPSFISTNNLHLNISAPSLHVPLIGSVAIDFDGDPRTACSNAAGADNFTTAPAFTMIQPTVTYANCFAKVAFEINGGIPAFRYSLNGGNYSAAIVDSATIQGNRAVHFEIPVAAGTYTLNLRDVNNCNFTPAMSFTIIAYPAPAVDAVDNACIGDRVMFTATPTAMSNYLWGALPGGTIEDVVAANQKYFTWDVMGTKTVSATVTDPNGCVRTATKEIVIYPQPEPAPTYRVPNRP